MGCKAGVLRKLVRMFLLLCLIWFLFLGLLSKSEARSAPATEQTADNAILRGTNFTGGGVIPKDCDLSCASKRRVPNGPDPIHNRGAGKLRQQPGKA